MEKTKVENDEDSPWEGLWYVHARCLSRALKASESYVVGLPFITTT